MAHQEEVYTIQGELCLLIEQNNALVAQQKQMGEFLANCKIYVDGLQKENIALLEENNSSNNAGYSLPEEKKPYVMMIVGVNGVGKTTTIGKLAHQFKSAGK